MVHEDSGGYALMLKLQGMVYTLLRGGAEVVHEEYILLQKVVSEIQKLYGHKKAA